MTQLSIIIPCYNESANLPNLIEKCKAVIDAEPLAEIILVNNGSTDQSQEVLDKLLPEMSISGLRSIQLQVNKGYGYGILEGLKVAHSEILCWTHADLQTDIFDCIKALRIYQQNTDTNLIVKGRRTGRSLFDRMFTSWMSFYVLVKLGEYIPDINAQPKLFSRQFFQQAVLNAPADFSLDLHFLLYGKRKGKILEFPVFFHKRIAGEAKGGSGDIRLKIKLMKRSLNYINKLKSAY